MRYKDMSNKPYSCETCVHNTKEWYELPCDACCAAHCGYVKREEGGRMSDLIGRQAAIDGFYEMASDIDHLCTVGDYISFLESLSAQPEIIRCKDCKHFHYDMPYVIQGIPVLAHEVCNAWGDGCKTDENGWCFLAERRTDENN